MCIYKKKILAFSISLNGYIYVTSRNKPIVFQTVVSDRTISQSLKYQRSTTSVSVKNEYLIFEEKKYIPLFLYFFLQIIAYRITQQLGTGMKMSCQHFPLSGEIPRRNSNTALTQVQVEYNTGPGRI